MQKLLTVFSKNISIYAIFNGQSFKDTLTNNIISFEQLGPGFYKINHWKFNLIKVWHYFISDRNIEIYVKILDVSKVTLCDYLGWPWMTLVNIDY